MVKNLKRMKKQVEREKGAEEAAQYDFFPTTFILPSEYQMFVEEFKRSSQVPKYTSSAPTDLTHIFQ